MTTFHPTNKIVELPINLRHADYDDLLKLEWYGQYTHYRQLYRRAYREQLQGKRIMLLADCNGFPIGQLFIQLKSGNKRIADGKTRAYFYSFRVMEMFQGLGIGTWLVQEAETTLIDRGVQWATIAVSKKNHSALRLYERLNYKKFAEDSGKWHYTDHNGIIHHVDDPCWILEKYLLMR